MSGAALHDPDYSWREHRPPDLELGDGHALWFCAWRPDRALNPQYRDIPDVVKHTCVIEHKTTAGRLCVSALHLDTPDVQRAEAATRAHCESRGHTYYDYPRWEVVAWEPLTLAPSILCRACGDHGWIRAGRWERA